MDEKLIKPTKVRCSVKIRNPQVFDDEAEDYVDGTEDVKLEGTTMVKVKDPNRLGEREFRADYVHDKNAQKEDVVFTDLAQSWEAPLNGTDSILVIAGTQDGEQGDLMDGPDGIAASAVWQLSTELQDRLASNRANGAFAYAWNLRLQVFRLEGDTIQDLLTDSPAAARLVDTPEVGVAIDGLRVVSTTSPDDIVKFVEGAQRRMDPATRHQASFFYIIEVTQADYQDLGGWGLYGRFMIVETSVMDCLAQDAGLNYKKEGFDRYRGNYHFRTLVDTWKREEPGDFNSTSLTWLLRDMLTGGPVVCNVVFCLPQGKPAVSIAMMELMEKLMNVKTNPVSQDHRVAGALRAMRSERIKLKQDSFNGRVAPDLNKETRNLILDLEKRLELAERTKDDAVRSADVRQARAHDFQDRYVNALTQQEQLQESIILSEEDQLSVAQSLVEAQLETSEAQDELSELRYTDGVLLIMLEQEAEEEAASLRRIEDSFRQTEDRILSEFRDARDRVDEVNEAKTSLEVQRVVERDKAENRIQELSLELRSSGLDKSQARFEEQKKNSEEFNEYRQRAQLALEEQRKGDQLALRDQQARGQEELNAAQLALEEQRKGDQLALHQQQARGQDELNAEAQKHQQDLASEKEWCDGELDRIQKAFEQERQTLGGKLQSSEDEVSEKENSSLALLEETRALRHETAEERDKANLEEQQARVIQENLDTATKQLDEARKEFLGQLKMIGEADDKSGEALKAFQLQYDTAELREKRYNEEALALQFELLERNHEINRLRGLAGLSSHAPSTPGTDAYVDQAAEALARHALKSPSDRPGQESRLPSAQEPRLPSASGYQAPSGYIPPYQLGDRSEELQREVHVLQGKLDRKEQEFLALRAQQATELRQRGIQIDKLEAELASYKASGVSPGAATPPGPGGARASQVGRLEQIQSRLLDEVQHLRDGPDANLEDQNRSLQSRLAMLEQKSPAERRAQVQRLAFLEKSVRELEAERSELIVRATVAEEQVKQLGKHLKDMTEDYQNQILRLKLQTQR